MCAITKGLERLPTLPLEARICNRLGRPFLQINKAVVQILAVDSGVMSTRPTMPPAAAQKHGRPGPVPLERPTAQNQQKRRGRPRKAEEGEDDLIKVKCSAEETLGR